MKMHVQKQKIVEKLIRKHTKKNKRQYYYENVAEKKKYKREETLINNKCKTLISS